MDDAGVNPGMEDGKWERIAAMEEFRSLLRTKVRFVVPACIFFVSYYFALPVLVGYAPALMGKKIIGPVNLAYVFALSQFVMAWTSAWLYVRAARRFDQLGRSIAERLRLEGRED
jgi:uncharacterized membrane protein (DUF485 family)